MEEESNEIFIDISYSLLESQGDWDLLSIYDEYTREDSNLITTKEDKEKNPVQILDTAKVKIHCG